MTGFELFESSSLKQFHTFNKNIFEKLRASYHPAFFDYLKDTFYCNSCAFPFMVC